MAYCRFSEGDVHLVQSASGRWACNSCRLHPETKTRYFESLRLISIHLEAHRAAGHTVPQIAFERVRAELQAEWAEQARAEFRALKHTIFEKPTPAAINALLELYFDDSRCFDAHGDLLALLLQAVPRDDWELRFLARCAMKAPDELRGDEACAQLLTHASAFHERMAVAATLAGWQRQLDMGDPAVDEDLSAETRLLRAIFGLGSVDRSELRHQIGAALAQVS
jgi:hypothetical protein